RQLDEGCGISGRTNLIRALQGLEAKGVITATRSAGEKGDAQTTVYSLRFEGVVTSQDYPPEGVVTQRDHLGSDATGLPVVTSRDPQETGSQDTVEQETGKSLRISNADPLEKLMIQVSHDLGDGHHTRSNVSRMWNLLEDNGEVTDEQMTRII